MKYFTNTFLSAMFLVAMCIPSLAQTDVLIEYTAESQLSVNSFTVTSSTTPEELKAVLGTPSREEVSTGGETGYFYDDVGLIFSSKHGKVIGLGVNYNWDGDVKFPKTSYTGTMSLGELSITKETNSTEIGNIQNVSFSCPIPLMCVSTDKTAAIKCAVAFNASKLSQIVFIFS
jgi:hypothetical protein